MERNENGQRLPNCRRVIMAEGGLTTGEKVGGALLQGVGPIPLTVALGAGVGSVAFHIGEEADLSDYDYAILASL